MQWAVAVSAVEPVSYSSGKSQAVVGLKESGPVPALLDTSPPTPRLAASQHMNEGNEQADASLREADKASASLDSKYLVSLALANTTLQGQVDQPSPPSKAVSTPEPLQPYLLNHPANGESHHHLDHQLSSPQPLGSLKHSLPHPSSGGKTDIDKLQLRLQKAERALEHERTHSDMLRQQLAAKQSAAQVGEHASSTIQALEADLAKARALAEQRTSEGEALRRALLLSDETVARLRQQLAGVLESNQLALAREQQMEQQVADLRKQLAEQAEQHAAQLAAAHAGTQQAAEHATQSSAALRHEVGRLKQDNHQLATRISQQEAALNAAKAECARKDAGIRALETVLSRTAPQPHTLDPPGLPATVTIDILAVDGSNDTSATTSEILTGGLTDNQWKLVMLSEEVRCLRASVAQLRLRQEAQAAGLPVPELPERAGGAAGGGQREAPGAAAGPSASDTTAGEAGVPAGAVNHDEDDMKEVVEVDLPAEEIKALIGRLADQMLSLEEELQQLTQPQSVPDAQAGAGKHEVLESMGTAQGNGHAGEAAHVVRQQPGEGPLTGRQPGFEVEGYTRSQRRGRKKGWFGWLLGSPSDDSLV